MIGAFVAMGGLQSVGLAGQSVGLTGLPLVGVLLTALVVTLVFSGALGAAIERYSLRPLRGIQGPAAIQPEGRLSGAGPPAIRETIESLAGLYVGAA